MLKITILTENLVRQRSLLAEHGLSLWIENDEERVLFDTGQTDVYLHNAQVLGIDWIKAQAIVISHGHYDHGGGLMYFPEEARWPRVFIHPDACLPKYVASKHPHEPHRAAGFPWKAADMPNLEHRLMLNNSTMQVGEQMTVIADIPHTVDFEAVADDLLIEKDGYLLPDPMRDEQMLICSQPQGMVVMLGCSHPGVVNCLKYIQLLYPDQPIHTVIGGMHLERADPRRLNQTIDYFRSMNIQQIVPLHCTGQRVIYQMKSELGDRVLIRSTGDTIEI